MPSLIQDRGRGPEITGTRITVYNLLQAFLDSTVTEEEICRVYSLSPQQVAAARAYVLSNSDTVLAEHLKIEEPLAAGNPPEVRDRAGRAKKTFEAFKRWLQDREVAEAQEKGPVNTAGRVMPSEFTCGLAWMRRQQCSRSLATLRAKPTRVGALARCHLP